MRMIESYEELSPLLSAQFKPGVRTNAFSSADDYRREIAAGTLAVEATDNALFLLRDRGDFQRLHFYLRDGASPPAFNKTTVVEIALRPRDAALAETVERFKGAGWREAFLRARLIRPKDLPVDGGTCPHVARTADEADFDAVSAVFAECFDPLTGCSPTADELREILRRGDLIVTDAQDGVAGLLHIGAAKGGSELRHLAVSKAYRRRGAAQALMPLYMEKTGFARSLVWVRQGNAPAEAFYRKNGYEPDGCTSVVLIYDKGD